MCTAIHFGNFFGRTLDLECSHGEEVVVMPRGYKLHFIHEGTKIMKYSVVGTAHMAGGVPLFYDAINSAGVGVAALNFPGYAVYYDRCEEKTNLASFEVISYILGECGSLAEAKKLLLRTNITKDSFSPKLKSTPLHWMVADREGSIVCEAVSGGIRIYENFVGVMTNAPSFDFHLTRLADFMQLSPSVPENRLVPKAEIKPYSRGMGAMGLPGDFSSVSRLVRATFVKENIIVREGEELESFFHIMDAVSVPLGCATSESGEPVSTVYTSCADLDRGEYFFTTYKNRKIRKITLSECGMCGLLRHPMEI